MALEIRRSRTVEAEVQRSRRVRVFDDSLDAASRLRDDEAPRAVEVVCHTRIQNAGQASGRGRRGAGFDGDIRMYDQAHVLAPVRREEAAARRHDEALQHAVVLAFAVAEEVDEQRLVHVLEARDRRRARVGRRRAVVQGLVV